MSNHRQRQIDRCRKHAQRRGGHHSIGVINTSKDDNKEVPDDKNIREIREVNVKELRDQLDKIEEIEEVDIEEVHEGDVEEFPEGK